MGSWDESCDLSGLPIKAGDRTVAFAVCKTPICDPLQKENVSVCYPVTFAMRGKYNDYGGVDRVEKTFTTEILAQEVLEADDLNLSDPDYLLSLLYERQLSLGRDGVKGVPALFLVREDIYEYLLTDKYVEEWIYRDHADSYRELLEKDAQRF